MTDLNLFDEMPDQPYIPPRPMFSDKTRRTAILSIAEEVQRWYGLSDDERDLDDVIDELKDGLDSFGQHDDGFDLCKALESNGWDTDRELMDILDGINSYSALRSEVKEWVKAFNIKPKFSIGDQVKYPRRDYRKGSATYRQLLTVTGEITSINADEATYGICTPEHGDKKAVPGELGSSAIVIAFEEVIGAVTEEAAP